MEHSLNGRFSREQIRYMKTLHIATDYSAVPAGRYYTDGPFTGERFRNEFLIPLLHDNAKVCVDIDGAAGYGSSFLEEAFAGLVRNGSYSPRELHEKLEITAADPTFVPYIDLIWNFIDAAKKQG